MRAENFTIPKLCIRGGDLAKQWYVYFYYVDLDGKKRQFRFSDGINQLKTKGERISEGNALIRALLDHLEGGWNPISNEVEEHENKTILEAIDEIFEIKKAYLTEASIRTYKNQTNLFKKWLKIKRYDHLYTENFTSFHARKYCDWLLRDKKYCGKTYNGHLTMLRTFFTEMVGRGYVKESPVSGFKSVRQDVGKNTAYSENEEKLFESIKLKDPCFYLATRFVKYCFLRRTELAKVQVKHINWDNKTLVIPSENAKSRIQDSVTIPKTLERMIEKAGFKELHPDTYLFGKFFLPNEQRIKRVDDFSDKQRYYNKKLNIRSECTFYSWKHTGTVELYNLTKDPYVVMRQCRHSNIDMTMIYLRSLGCGINEQVREW